MDFTREQEQAISLRDEDILVSAGAGAGKTRVLVNRMAALITDPQQPFSVDSFLVMTFTNAAAEEMRERITGELNARLMQAADPRYLRRQIRAMKHADISTVHSFCNRLIHQHFQELGIDPSFRIGEEGELVLLRQRVMEELMEESYASGRESFLTFVEAYAPDKSDGPIEDLIRETYAFLRCTPDSDRWIDAMFLEMDRLASPQLFSRSAGFLHAMARTKSMLEEAAAELEDGLSLFAEKTEPEAEDAWKALLQEDKTGIEELRQRSSALYAAAKQAGAGEEYDAFFSAYDEMAEAFHRLSFPAAPRTKAALNSPYKDGAKAVHQSVRKRITSLGEMFFACRLREIAEENSAVRPFTEELIFLAKRFETLYFKQKKEQNVYDFDDLEHLALTLLVAGYDEEGNPLPTETAKEVSRKYKAIFVDEYQDTNLVQETILKVLCREGNHLFTVGDVKQSIYSFRQARPDLFLSRLHRYDRENCGVNIELRDNFRSAPGVLHFCNLVFRALMERDFGGVEYDDSVALRPGENGPMAACDAESEFLLVENDGSASAPAMTDLEAETAVIAGRIKDLLKEGYKLGDMVILLRSAKGWAEPMAQLLSDAGIPAVCDSKTGYFETREVQLALNYLAVVDNVYQDIPMASVLLSPIGDLSEAELAALKTLVRPPLRKEYSLYDLMKLCLSEGKTSGAGDKNPEKEIDGIDFCEKLKAFMDQLLYFREKKKESALHDLLWEIYQKTGLYDAVQLMPEGETRKENLLMLLKRAEEYEKTVFKGLFHFLRYMDQLQTYELDFGETILQQKDDDTVKIMTIHKSKGLEFPVVFVSGLSKQFNLRDTSDPVLFHPELGIGMEYVDLAHRTRRASFLKKTIKEQRIKESLEEELRILYVAMTRAERKLYLTGVVKREKAEEAKKKGRLSLENKLAARSVMDWLLPMAEQLPAKRMQAVSLKKEREQAVEKKERPSLEAWMQREEMQLDTSRLKESFSYVYPHREASQWKRKYSVSELKRLSDTTPEGEEDWEGESLFEASGEKSEKTSISPTKRGTIVHKIMELLPFKEITTKRELCDAMEEVQRIYPDSGDVSAAWVCKKAEQFLFSPVGEKVRSLDRKGRLYKELPFTVGLPAALIYPDCADGPDARERIVVQGVIDLCGEDEEGFWLLDYKTDSIRKGEEGVLLDRYQTQMVYYKTALEQIYHKKVSHIYLFSFALGECIKVDLE